MIVAITSWINVRSRSEIFPSKRIIWPFYGALEAVVSSDWTAYIALCVVDSEKIWISNPIKKENNVCVHITMFYKCVIEI